MDKEEILKENGNKRWDICLMNPPYSKNLHLKFLEHTIKLANNVISIQPITWLEDIGGQLKDKSNYKKYEDSISKHIKSLEKIKGKDATNYFGSEKNMAMPQDLGIYICDKNGGYNYSKLGLNKFPFNLYKKKEFPFKIGIYKDHKFENIVPIGNINGCVKRGYPSVNITTKYGAFNKGKNKDNKTFEQLKHENPKFTFGNIDTTKVIIFDTFNEAQNFLDLCRSIFWKVICYKSTVGNSIPIEVLPWPKTYTEKWTEEKLIKYFNMTKDDIDEYNIYKSELQKIFNNLNWNGD